MPRSIKLLIFLVILAISLPFIIRGKDGRPLLKLNYFKAPKRVMASLSGATEKGRELADTVQQKFEQSRESLNNTLDATASESTIPTTVYKWRGKDGTWIFSDQPNPSGESQQILVDSRATTPPVPKTGRRPAHSERTESPPKAQP